MKDGIQSNKEHLKTWFQEERLTAFRKCVHESHSPDDGITRRGQAYAKGLPDVDLAALPEKDVKRSDVLKLAANSDANVPTVSAAIMAWGGMDERCRDLLFKESDPEWVKVAEDIRCGAIDRKTAYDRLRELRSKRKLKGAGPAYFTKLIYFFTPRSGAALRMGYIMDQWAGCSVNLLTGRDVVRMNITMTWKRSRGDLVPAFSFSVSDHNTGDDYEQFCSAVDCLASCFGFTPEKVDRELVSSGGRNPEDWRRYVSEQRQRFIFDDPKLTGD